MVHPVFGPEPKITTHVFHPSRQVTEGLWFLYAKGAELHPEEHVFRDHIILRPVAFAAFAAFAVCVGRAAGSCCVARSQEFRM